MIGHLFFLKIYGFLCSAKAFKLIRSHLLIFVFVVITLGGGSEKILLWFMSESVQPMFSSKSFLVCGLIFRSLIYFEFIFVYGARKRPSFQNTIY